MAAKLEQPIINLHVEDEQMVVELTGYQRVGATFQRMLPNNQGRLLSATTRIGFAVDQPKHTVILTNEDTGERDRVSVDNCLSLRINPATDSEKSPQRLNVLIAVY
jgi:hypothetical protein